MAGRQGVRSLDLLAHGIVDRIVAEHPDAADEPAPFLQRLGRVLEHELAILLRRDTDALVAERLGRYRRLGVPS
jgi:acyl-CoA carboxylase subunit beta